MIGFSSLPPKQKRFASRWQGTRKERRDALATVFRELKCDTLRKQREALYWLAVHANMREEAFDVEESFDRKATRKWLERLNRKATELADLLQADPVPTASPWILTRLFNNQDAAQPFIAATRDLAAAALLKNRVGGAWREGPTPNDPTNAFVWTLGIQYKWATGEVGKLSTSWDKGAPGGHFYEFVCAAFTLVGERVTPQRVAGLIRRYALKVKD